MKQLFIILLLIPFLSIGQHSAEESNDITYYGRAFFRLEGTVIPDALKESPYDRLPLSYKERVRKPVWELSKSAAGMSIRFFSNTSSIRVKWTVLNDFKMNHMAETGIKGVDLYFKNKGNWHYLNTGRPEGIKNESTLIENMSGEMCEFKLFLPLYDGIVDLEIGIDSNSIIKKPLKNKRKPIIFYGTSITQGGCASRPGMAHTNIISRKLNIDCINFGFSGNGRMEQPIAKLISEADPLFYVIECLPNMLSPEQITNRTIPLVNTIRKNNPETPILFIENFIYEASVLDKKMEESLKELNSALHTEYKKMIQSGFHNIYYVTSENATGTDHEGTVDGVHFTDLGFIRYADFLIDTFDRFGLIDKN